MGVIMDLGWRKSLREDGRSNSSIGDAENKKSCTDCKTTKTPLWRGGPAGPKSLCNACGIRYRKKRTLRGMEKGPEKKKEKTTSHTTTTTTAATTNTEHKAVTGNGLINDSLKMSLMVWGEEMMVQRSSSIVKKQRCQRKRKMREEEQAAFLLMALSCGSVFA